MSYSIDTNLLLYASDESSPHHHAARRFLEGRPGDPDLLCLAWQVLLSYQRIATHPRIFSRPLTPKEALENIEALLGLPRVRLLVEEEQFLDVYREVTGGVTVRGNLVPDAHLAAILSQHGVRTLYTVDSDFKKFSFLSLRNPLVV